ncbi:peroxiredoxin [Pseudozobellia thermophila]|uniref:thioredoxin-dependent peroxiredoxin n=1 Tax=Pseudozobellia thermophila TaxID=192903 RepID=A0A1M6MR53_9FLAO|nr:peroxiredoxin [Pseudozobellia thermophila]SHJ85849.1 peroxiredoxin Q/BCP [Pseudozobellia thermophila]
MGLKVGDEIPDFTLPDQYGKVFSSADLKGKKPMVIYFYPKDDTPGCTKEACGFRDGYEQFQELGAEVIGISSDSSEKHRNFAEKHRLPFTLLADTDKKVRKAFKVEKHLLILPGRETYVVDRKGKVAMVFNSMGASRHIQEALKALKSIKL